MTYVVTEACMGVKGEGCMEVCTEHCIFTQPGDLMSYIDPVRCTDCGVCKEACVVGAIFADDEVPRASREFININQSWFRQKTSVRKRVREIASIMATWLT